MTQEKKDLLLKDLSARLPYHPFAYGKIGYTYNEGCLATVTSSGCTIMTGGGSHFHYFLNEIKLYLRPMSSMTKEEKEKYHSLCYEEEREILEFGEWVTRVYYHDTIDSIDYLNSIHIDYRRLIEKDLALEAPKGMYNVK